MSITPTVRGELVAPCSDSSHVGPLQGFAVTGRREVLVHPTLLYAERCASPEPIELNGRGVEIASGDCLVLGAGCSVQENASSLFDRTVTLNAVVPSIATFVAEFPKDVALGIGRITVPERDRARWGEALARLHHELTTQALRGREAAQALLTLLAVDAARYVGPIGPPPLSPRRVVAEVFAHINEHIAAPISLREIANAVNFSPAYLTDLVKRETGRPIVSWIIELRLHRAAQLLSHTDLSISQIAARVGYGDANSFGRAFTKRRGLSPWQWRRRYQSGVKTERH
jgi:AraC-like DNA-binding protein